MRNTRPTTPHARSRRQRGAAAILAMMFLVIFASLATAMAIVSQGNLRTADSHLKINRSLSAAETGVNFLVYRINQLTPAIKTKAGIVDHDLAVTMWSQLADALMDNLDGDYALLAEPYAGAAPYKVVNRIVLPPMPISPGGGATFSATLEPHPLPGENYDSAFYQRPPYSTMAVPVSAEAPLDATWVRVKVVGADGPVGKAIYRTITMDFRMDKKLRYAILSKSRIMVGRNVMIEGTIGSRFMETHLPNGHPVQIESDFNGLNSDLDDLLESLRNTLVTNDQDGDNRLHVYDALETEGVPNAASLDLNEDGYIDDYDFFLDAFDADADGAVSQFELEDGTGGPGITANQFMELIDTFGSPNRAGYNDGLINDLDRYAKIRGEIRVTAAVSDWEGGAAGGPYQNYLQGPIVPDHHEDPMTFEAGDDHIYDYEPEDFNDASANLSSIATNDLMTQANSNLASGTGSRPPNVVEKMPFDSPHPYDYYERPVFQGMTFEDVRIPKGTNALFINCTFIGATYVDTEVNNFAPHYDDAAVNAFNYSGMWENASGTVKHPDIDANLKDQGYLPDAVENGTKSLGNNIRFHNCTFEGAIGTASPLQFSHTRNKLAFTGTTRFIVDQSAHLDADQKKLYKRSTLMTPNFSIEMGTFIGAADAGETVELSGTIVAGVLDLRGQVKINGTILTTFEPKSGQGPVLGDTSPNFNTTLGYFPSAAGDLEAELPPDGLGVVHVRYDPTIPMPDGINGPIELRPEYSTYFEGETQ